jgi:hypothetical protein
VEPEKGGGLSAKENRMGNLAGKIALLAATAASALFAKEGAHVFVTGRRQREPAAAVKQIEKQCHRGARRRIQSRGS